MVLENEERKNIMILVPAFNEAKNIARVIDGCQEWGLPVVVVDDGSTDTTVSEAERVGATVIKHPENLGKGVGLVTGFNFAEKAGFEAVVTVDADGQHDPKLIGKFLDEYSATGADVIVGSRMHNLKPMPWLRRYTNRTSSLIISKIIGRRITDTQSGFRLVKTRVWLEANPKKPRYAAESELLIEVARRGGTIREVPISTIYAGSKSKMNPLLDGARFLKLALEAWLSFKRPGGRLLQAGVRED